MFSLLWCWWQCFVLDVKALSVGRRWSGRDAQPFLISCQDHVCPALLTAPTTQHRKKILGTVLQASILFSPLHAHPPQTHLSTTSSPPHSATLTLCYSASSDPSPHGMCIDCIHRLPVVHVWTVAWIYTACTSPERSLCSDLPMKMKLPWCVSLASDKAVDGAEKLFFCCF